MTSLYERLRATFMRWRIFALAGTLGLAAGIVQVLLTEQMFRAETSLAPAEQSAPLMAQLGSSLGLSGLAGIVPGLGGGDRDTEQMLALFGSREFALKFIDAYQLAPEMFSDDWDAQNKKWKKRPPKTRELLGRFNDMRNIAYDKLTGVVRVRLEWPNAARGSALLVQMVKDFNDYSRARAKTEAQSAIAYLTSELGKTDVTELRIALSRVMQQQMTRSMMATVQPEFALRTIDPPIALDKPVRPRYLVTPVLWIFTAMILALAWTVLRRRGIQLP